MRTSQRSSFRSRRHSLHRLRTVFSNTRSSTPSSSSDTTPRTRDPSPSSSIASTTTTSSTTSSIHALLSSRLEQHRRNRSVKELEVDDDVVGLLEPRPWKEDGAACLGIMEVLEGW